MGDRDHSVTGSRGATGCGMFHEFVPGPDGFCDCCRPSPERIKPAEDWLRSKGKTPERGTAEWRKGLEEWVDAGRPVVKTDG